MSVAILDDKAHRTRFGVLVLVQNPLDRPVVADGDIVAENDTTVIDLPQSTLSVRITTPLAGAARYTVLVADVGAGVIDGTTGDFELAMNLPPVETETVRYVQIRGEGATLGLHSATIEVTQYPFIPDVEETAIANVIPPAIVPDPINGVKVGATITYTEGEWTGTITGTSVLWYVTATSDPDTTDVQDYAPEDDTIPSEWLGQKFLVEVTKTGPGSPLTVRSALSATVTADAIDVKPPRPEPDDWDLLAERYPLPSSPDFRGLIRVADELGVVVDLRWTGVDVGNWPTPELLEPHWKPAEDLGGGLWGFLPREGENDHIRPPGNVMSRIRFQYRLEVGGLWSDYPVDAKVLSEALIAEEPPVTGGGWRLMPFRSAEELAQGLRGGCQEQFMHGGDRSRLAPSLIVLAQDTAGIWYSDDDGITHRKAEDSGLTGIGMQSVMIDAEDPNIWYAVGAVNSAAGPGGMYKSLNKGKNWTQKRALTNMRHQRVPGAITRDPTTSGSSTILYTTVSYWDGGNDVWRSTDRGETWSLRSTIPLTGTSTQARGRLIEVCHSTTAANVVYLCTMSGLFKSTNGASTWTALSGSGGLPNQHIMHVEMNPNDGNEFYCVTSVPRVNNVPQPGRLWRTTNGGSSFTEIPIPANVPASKVYVAQQNGAWEAVESRTMYLVSQGVTNPAPSASGQLRYSHNGGGSWTVASVTGRPGQAGPWENNISDNPLTGSRPEMCTRILPHPTDRNKAFAHSKSHHFRTEDRGVTWRYSGEGFSGLIWGNYNSGVAFTSSPDRFCFGNTDAGMVITYNGGRSFLSAGCSGAPDPAGGTVLGSMHAVAMHPTSNIIVASCGFMQANSRTYLFRTTSTNPGYWAAGNWTRVSNQNNAYIYLQWNHDTPTVVYSNSFRSTDSGVSFGNYPANVGTVIACAPSDNDIIYGVSGNTIRWSQNTGDTAADFVTLGYAPLGGDVRFHAFAVHPTNPNIIYLRSSNNDLASYNRTTGTLKTNYGLLALAAAASGTTGHSLRSIAVDPQDPDVAYASMDLLGGAVILRTLNLQASNPTWTVVTYGLYRTRSGIIRVDPHTGDALYGTNGVGACRFLPPPAARSSPSRAPNFTIY